MPLAPGPDENSQRSAAADPAARVDLPFEQYERLQARIEEQLTCYGAAVSHPGMTKLLRSALWPGRRLRPVLFYRLCAVSDRSAPDGIAASDLDRVALAIELGHRASIILDDLIDRDDARHASTTFHAAHGGELALLVSHVLVAGVFSQLAALAPARRAALLPLFTDTYARMCAGQIADLGERLPRGRYLPRYEAAVVPKTTAMFELVFGAAAATREVEAGERERWRELGYQIGRVVQIHNDIYDDLYASPDERGRKRRWRISLTLPKCILLDYGSDAERAELLNYVGMTCSFEEYRTISARLRARPYLEQAERYATEALSHVRSMLDQITDPQIRAAGLQFCDWIRRRHSWDHAQRVLPPTNADAPG